MNLFTSTPSVKKFSKSFFIIASLLLCILHACKSPQTQISVAPSTDEALIPKREFRGAWLPTVTGDYYQMSQEEMQRKLIKQLDALQAAGINAVLFQIRPSADALYHSTLEPWSRWLTGAQGISPGWDPTEWMINECHKRNMEMHAWLNPYRVKQHLAERLAPNHIYFQHPEWFVSYGDKLFFNPALQQSRDFICEVIKDILAKYDVDGIHMDDYFYPYPIAGKEFPDIQEYQTMGLQFQNIGNWRRQNVNLLIEQLHKTIKQQKPWVKFGVSPFGIYRNQKNDPDGSATNGLENYGDLYADILKWTRSGWLDYIIPQVYWQIGHPVADYNVLVDWWSNHTNDRHLFIGQSVLRTVKYPDLVNPSKHQFTAKMIKQRGLSSVTGSCQWPGRCIVDNLGTIADSLRLKYHSAPALQPQYPWIDAQAPDVVRRLKAQWRADGYVLTWQAPEIKDLYSMLKDSEQNEHGRKIAFELARTDKFVIYRFEKGQPVDLSNPHRIIAITKDNEWKLPYRNGRNRYTYVVTALDRMQNESAGKKVSVRL